MQNTITLEGYAAIEYAEAHGLTLSKYNDPTEDAREGLTPDEARAVAREDARLIYLGLSLAGWTEGDGTGHDGYNVADYFIDGKYQGPDAHGIEPIMAIEPKTTVDHSHSKDSDCTVDPATLCCSACGVDHSEECPDCHQRGFHSDGCYLSDGSRLVERDDSTWPPR